MMDGDQFRQYVTNRFGADASQLAGLGTANTNWQDEVLRTAVSSDYNLSVGGTVGILPYRVSVGYTSNHGIIRKTGMNRATAGINLSPKFFDGLLQVNANIKGAYVRNNYEPGVLGGAIAFNPTLPVKNPNGNVFNDWTTYISGGLVAYPDTPGSAINTIETINPVSRIQDYDSKSDVYQSVGNLQARPAHAVPPRSPCQPQPRLRLQPRFGIKLQPSFLAPGLERRSPFTRCGRCSERRLHHHQLREAAYLQPPS